MILIVIYGAIGLVVAAWLVRISSVVEGLRIKRIVRACLIGMLWLPIGIVAGLARILERLFGYGH